MHSHFKYFVFFFISSFIFANPSPFAVGDAQKGALSLGVKLSRDWEFLARDLDFYKKRLNVVKSTKKSNQFDFWLETQRDNLSVWRYNFKRRNWDEILTNINKPKSRLEERKVSDKVVKKILGVSLSLFQYDLIYTSRVPSQRHKEIFQVDFDGNDQKRLTYDKGIITSPSITKDGNKIAYTLIPLARGRRQASSVLYDIKNKKKLVLVSRDGAHSGVCFGPKEDEVFISLSHEGKSQIYSYNLTSKKLEKRTFLRGLNVDPSLDLSGNLLTFLSSQSGRPMVYLKNLNRREAAKRLSFVGKYNSNPRFSPDAKSIIFSSWMSRSFDLYRIDIASKQIDRLTQGDGSIEEASYFPGGDFIVLASTPILGSSASQLYLYTKEGELIRRLSQLSSGATSPRWKRLF